LAFLSSNHLFLSAQASDPNIIPVLDIILYTRNFNWTSLNVFFFLIFCWPYISIYLFLNINQLDALNFIISLFQVSTCFEHMCSSSGGQNRILQSLVSSHWKSEWSKITKIIKILFYKYEHMVVKFVWIFWVWLLCITYYKYVMTCRGYV
jgi:hypothetical protein